MKFYKLFTLVSFLCFLLGCTEKETQVEVSSVSLNTATIEMVEGETFNLVATVLPTDAEYGSVEWSSSDPSVASVNSGKVLALKEGTTFIKAVAGGKSTLCFVKVLAKTDIVEVASITLDKTSLSIKVGDSGTIRATVFPENATNKTVIWESSDALIATVSEGKVAAKKVGTVNITAKSGKYSAKCVVNVTNASVESITLDKTSLSLSVGETATLVADVRPSNAATVTWSSSNPSVATVEDGVVTAVNVGSTEISAMSGGKKAKCTVDVSAWQPDYLSFSTSSGSNAVSVYLNGNIKPGFEYSYDGETWGKWDYSWLDFSTDRKLYLRGSNGISGVCFKFRKDSPNVICDGDINTLFYYHSVINEIKTPNAFEWLFHNCKALIKSPRLPAKSLSPYCYRKMFSGCTNLQRVPDLPATVLSENCYNSMFENCESITEAMSVLPAITLSESCYTSMFAGCKKLLKTPKIMATSFASGCCLRMFSGCSSLIDVKDVFPSVRKLAPSCCGAMFSGCSSLKVAPSLPLKNLEDDCYGWMFYNCSSLITPPDLPASVLKQNCYDHMFGNCSSLTIMPKLNANVLASGCYSGMFSGCSSLSETQKSLDAEILCGSCYLGMFKGCVSLKTAPDLPATKLAWQCYYEMFDGCSSLERAPVLPALKLEKRCYFRMFNNCNSLNYVKAMFTESPYDYCYDNLPATSDWLSGVSFKGTFIRNKKATWLGFEKKIIPLEWDVVEVDE